MADELKARPVSGEIMTAGQSGAIARASGPDVVDAEYETVDPDLGAAERAGRPSAGPVFAPDPAPVAGMNMLVGGPAKSGPSSRGGPFFWVVGLALVAGAFWVSGGHALVRQPGSVSAPALQAAFDDLKITGVTSRVDSANGRAVLFVDGAALNEGSGARALPPIEIRVTGGDGQITRYNLGTSDRPLAPGGRFDFSSRLEVPKDGVKSVSVTFRESGDAGGQGQGH